MKLVYPGPDGQLITVADPRPSKPGKPTKTISVAADSRPAHFVLTTFTV
ncbi:MAG TPA: hypothetical protein VFE22_07780 [Edaphobacter sp.]|jgi:hypothetical protein|nr:hypothetical protein [Edaphobacter sp.]